MWIIEQEASQWRGSSKYTGNIQIMVGKQLEKLGLLTRAHRNELSRILKEFFRSYGFMSMSPLILKATWKF